MPKYHFTDDDGTQLTINISNRTYRDLEKLSPEDMQAVQPQVLNLYEKEVRKARQAHQVKDIGRGAVTGAAKALPAVAGIPGDLQAIFRAVAPQAAQDIAGKSPVQVDFPTSEAIYQGQIPGTSVSIQDLKRKMVRDPTTPPGRILSGTLEGAIAPARSRPVRNALVGATGGAAATAAQEVIPDTGVWGALTAGALGGAVPGAIATRFPSAKIRAENIIADRAGQITPTQFDEAIQLQEQTAPGLRVDMTGAEALGTNPLLSLQQDVGELSPGAASVMEALTARRTGPEGQVANAATRFVDQLDPAATPGISPTAFLEDVGRRASDAAGRSRVAIGRDIDDISGLSRMIPDAPVGGVPWQQVGQLHRDMQRYVRGIPSGQEVPALRNAMSVLHRANQQPRYQRNPRELYRAYRRLRDERRGLQMSENAGEKSAGRILREQGFEERLLDLIEAQNPQIGPARRRYAELAARYRDPADTGALGKLDLAEKDAAKAFALMEDYLTKPELASPPQIQSLLSRLGRWDPNLSRDFTRVWMTNQIDNSFKDLMSGPQIRGGPKLSVAAAGTRATRANMRTILRDVARQAGVPGSEYADGFQTLMNVIRRASAFGHPGSATARRGSLKGEAGGELDVDLLNIKNIADRLFGTGVNERLREKTLTHVAEILAAPDSVRQIRKLGQRGARRTGSTMIDAVSLAAFVLAGAERAMGDELAAEPEV